MRAGNFTSSEIGKLMSNGRKEGEPGAPFWDYIEEKNMERRLGRSVKDDIDARATSWGNLLENRVFELLGLEYTLMGKDVYKHPTIDCWSGSPDCTKKNTVGDVKCPITLKSFCQLVDGKDISVIRKKHRDGDKYFWQLVSNAILTNSKYAELIVYCPYKSELEAIRDLASSAVNDGENAQKYMRFFYAQDSEMPFLPDNGFYKNLNVISFEVKDEWKQSLTDRVLMAEKMLVKRIELVPEQ